VSAARILVVDDDAANRKLVTALLSFEGYTISQASDGSEALKVAQAERPDLVVSDILMPTMDGYELVRRLRAEPSLAGTAVIFYTANYHERSAHALATQCGADRVIVKPCKSARFLAIVKETLAQVPDRSYAPPDTRLDSAHLQLLTDKLSGTADELRAANARLAALVELNLRLASEREPRDLLEKVCAGARSLLAARCAVLAVKNRASEAGTAFFTTSGVEGRPPAESVSIDSGLLGRVMNTRRAARAANASGGLVDVGLPEALLPIHSVLVAPVASLTRSYGWICLADKLGATEFTSEDERLLTILGAQVGRIYENGSLYQEVQHHAAQLLVEMDERERAVADLRASEELFRQLAQNIQDVLFIASADLQTLFFVSAAYERVWARSSAALIREPGLWVEALHPADRDMVIREQQRIVALLPRVGELEFRIVRPDGAERWILTRIFPIADAQGKVVRAAGISSDITERKLAENRNVHLTRMHAMLSGINSLIVRVVNKDDLLREACRLALEPGHFSIASCFLLDAEKRQSGAFAWAGRQPQLESQFRSVRGELPGPAAITERAIAAKRPVIVNDMRLDSAGFEGRHVLLSHGYRSLVALPLVVGDAGVGCLVLVSDEEDFFDDEEMRLLTELSGDISFALDHIEKAERLAYLASYDSLTGLANRSLFLERVSQHASAGMRSGNPFAVVVADPEKFSLINDVFGRSNADHLLRLVSNRFAQCAGGAELVARIGSDQLAAIVPGRTDGIDLSRTLQVLWDAWLSEPFSINGQAVTVTARAGAAVFPADGADAETLVRNAEAALGSAKASARAFATYTPQLSERMVERAAFEQNLRLALENEQFVLHYQPKVDLQTRQIEGLEALIRWQSPELGLVPPAKFIPLVEQNGMIIDIGAWALRQASLDRSRWIERGLNAPRVAVNVSTVQLRQEDFVRRISTIIRLVGRDHGIDIEVTESLLMDDVADNLQKLAAIHNLGINIALDDFGTGYSSLAYLTRLPVQTLKIDRSFVSMMLDDPGAMTLVSTIISLARALKLETVAEGVESEDQAKILRLIQCDQMQGFLVSKPLPFDEMTAFLSRSRN
jgi:diguanylate cyclase (GGDEF)-like protein/PAS domain S-box-containing protein